MRDVFQSGNLNVLTESERKFREFWVCQGKLYQIIKNIFTLQVSK